MGKPSLSSDEFEKQKKKYENKDIEHKLKELRTKSDHPFITFFLEHPAIGGSSICIFFSVIGVFYSWSLYSHFQINIFDYAETNDFLMAAFKDRFAFLITIGCFMIGWGYCYIIFQRNFFKKWISENSDPIPSRIFYLILLFLIIIPATYFPTSLASKKHANSLKEEKIIVNVKYSTGQAESKPVLGTIVSSLIGSTEKFMFFYSKGETTVIPISKIISLTSHAKGYEQETSEQNSDKKTIKNEKHK